MGCSADALARKLGISRLRQDEYALRSHELAAHSVAAGVFANELLPVAGLHVDERPRAGLTIGRLGRLPPAFAVDGTVTAGNSCGVSDGAAVLTVTAAEQALRARVPAIRIVAAAVAGGDPAFPGSAIPTAVQKLLRDRRCGEIAVEDIEAVEFTEAFAAVALAAIDGLNVNQDRVCSDGGAIGLGHPWGASGAILLVRLSSRMQRDDARFGLAACAIGGGQGIAMLLETLSPTQDFR
jgi:acetyl-CoA C-acetyltransferase